jgi:hypothetical protein
LELRLIVESGRSVEIERIGVCVLLGSRIARILLVDLTGDEPMGVLGLLRELTSVLLRAKREVRSVEIGKSVVSR